MECMNMMTNNRSSLNYVFLCLVIYYCAISITAEPNGNKKAVCSGNLTRCHDGTQCFKKTDFCNNKKDCNDSSDELFCGKQTCSSKEFPCLDGEQCVPRHHVCDNKHDCYDGSDEDVCEPSERCSLEHSRFLCRNGQQCIQIDRLCDKNSDCSDQSDEGDQCDQSVTSCSQGFCGQICIPTPTGPICQCQQGYLLHNKTCNDIDECDKHVCSQFCTNYPGSYNCSCETGYQLLSNGSCSAVGPDPVLYIATNHQILSLDIRSPSKGVTPLVQNIECIKSIATDHRHLYWTDCKQRAVFMYNLNGHEEAEVIIDTGLGSPEGISVDVVSSRLYVADSSKNRIFVCNTVADDCGVIQDNLNSPKDIIIAHKDRRLIWSEVGRPPSIKSSPLNGEKKSILVNDDIQFPQSLAVDEPLDRLYWIDSVLDRIESINLDGTNRKIILSRSVKHPFSIAVFEDLMYWVDHEHDSVMSADKNTGNHLLPIATEIDHVTSIVIDHPVIYQNHISSSKPSFVVASPIEGIYKLNKHLQKIDLNIANSSSDILSLEVDVNTGNIYYSTKKDRIYIFSPHSKTSRLLKKEVVAVSLAYDWIGGNLYISDDRQKQLLVCKSETKPLGCKTLIFDEKLKSVALYPEKGIMFAVNVAHMRQIVKICMNGQHREVIIDKDIGLPDSLTVDKPADRLYWIDVEYGTVETSNLFGKDRYTILKQSPTFRLTALDVFENYLYLSNRRSALLLILDKLGLRNPETIYKGTSILTDIKVVNPSMQQQDTDVCQTRKCEQLCLLTTGPRAECACYNGFLLHNDTVHCIDMKTRGTVILAKFPTTTVTSESELTTTKIGPASAETRGQVSTLSETRNQGPTPSETREVGPLSPKSRDLDSTSTETRDQGSTSKESRNPASCYLPCQHDGICVKSNTEDKCVCMSGYKGKICEIKEDNSYVTHSLVIGLGMVLLGLILAVTTIYFFKYKKDGYHYLLCRQKPDDAEGLVSEMSVRGPVINNNLFQQFDDINYPTECTDLKCSPSSQSVDSALSISKQEDSDSQSSFGIEENGGRYGYTQI